MLGLLLAFAGGALAASGVWLWWMARRLEERAAELARESDEAMARLLRLEFLHSEGVGQ